MTHVLEQHIGFLADATRVEAYRRAIHATVKPGDVVVDVGTGTGVLAFMALEAGAARVYGIEQGPIVGLARKLAQANGYGNRVQFIRAHAARVDLPEQADIVVSDLVGEFAFEAGLFDVLIDARTRWLKPAGRSIPSAITLYAAPVELPSLRQGLEFAAGRPAGFDMAPLAEHARNTAYHVYPSAESLLGPAAIVGQLTLPAASHPAINVELTVDVVRDGALDALAGWFDAELAPGVHMTNAPASPQRLDRRVVALPVSPPIQVRRGDTLSLSLRLLAADHVFRWRVCRPRAGGPPDVREGSTLKGLLISREDLQPFEIRDAS
jgi:protein arginine N-methyltransferase 1